LRIADLFFSQSYYSGFRVYLSFLSPFVFS